MGKFSKAYFDALAQAKAHHLTSKTYSGKLLRPHAPFILELIQKHAATSVLDYGCGKGSQYKWVSHGAAIPRGMTIGEFWGVPVTMFDPAYPPYATRPEGTFDIVICTHTLGAIPVTDQAAVVSDLYQYANKAVFIAEKIGPTKKQVFTDPAKFPRDWTREQWLTALRAVPNHKGIEVILSTRELTQQGSTMIREQL